MRPILSLEEVYFLIKAMPNEPTIWIGNDRERREKYKEIIAKGNRVELVRLIKTLYLHQQLQQGKGKKLNVADNQVMKEAEKMLCDEFAYVLAIEREQAIPFVLNKLSLRATKGCELYN